MGPKPTETDGPRRSTSPVPEGSTSRERPSVPPTTISGSGEHLAPDASAFGGRERYLWPCPPRGLIRLPIRRLGADLGDWRWFARTRVRRPPSAGHVRSYAKFR